MIETNTEAGPRMSKCVNCLNSTPRDEYLRQDLLCATCYDDFIRAITDQLPEADPLD